MRLITAIGCFLLLTSFVTSDPDVSHVKYTRRPYHKKPTTLSPKLSSDFPRKESTYMFKPKSINLKGIRNDKLTTEKLSTTTNTMPPTTPTTTVASTITTTTTTTTITTTPQPPPISSSTTPAIEIIEKDESLSVINNSDSISVSDMESKRSERDGKSLQNAWDIRHNIPGEPGVDYPIYFEAPDSKFDCENRHDGYYADTEARCQVFHVCANTALEERGFIFLCPNGTVFSQENFVCDWYTNVNCPESEKYYYKNEELGKFIGSKEEMLAEVQKMFNYTLKNLLNTRSTPNNGNDEAENSIANSIAGDNLDQKFGNFSALPILNPKMRKSGGNRTKGGATKTKTANKDEVYISNLGELSTDPGADFDINIVKKQAKLKSESDRLSKDKAGSISELWGQDIDQLDAILSQNRLKKSSDGNLYIEVRTPSSRSTPAASTITKRDVSHLTTPEYLPPNRYLPSLRKVNLRPQTGYQQFETTRPVTYTETVTTTQSSLQDLTKRTRPTTTRKVYTRRPTPTVKTMIVTPVPLSEPVATTRRPTFKLDLADNIDSVLQYRGNFQTTTEKPRGDQQPDDDFYDDVVDFESKKEKPIFQSSTVEIAAESPLSVVNNEIETSIKTTTDVDTAINTLFVLSSTLKNEPADLVDDNDGKTNFPSISSTVRNSLDENIVLNNEVTMMKRPIIILMPPYKINRTMDEKHEMVKVIEQTMKQTKTNLNQNSENLMVVFASGENITSSGEVVMLEEKINVRGDIQLEQVTEKEIPIEIGGNLNVETTTSESIQSLTEENQLSSTNGGDSILLLPPFGDEQSTISSIIKQIEQTTSSRDGPTVKISTQIIDLEDQDLDQILIDPERLNIRIRPEIDQQVVDKIESTTVRIDSGRKVALSQLEDVAQTNNRDDRLALIQKMIKILEQKMKPKQDDISTPTTKSPSIAVTSRFAQTTTTPRPVTQFSLDNIIKEQTNTSQSQGVGANLIFAMMKILESAQNKTKANARPGDGSLLQPIFSSLTNAQTESPIKIRDEDILNNEDILSKTISLLQNSDDDELKSILEVNELDSIRKNGNLIFLETTPKSQTTTSSVVVPVRNEIRVQEVTRTTEQKRPQIVEIIPDRLETDQNPQIKIKEVFRTTNSRPAHIDQIVEIRDNRVSGVGPVPSRTVQAQKPYVLDTVHEISQKGERPIAEPDIASQYPYGSEQLVSLNNVKAIPAVTTQSLDQVIVENSNDKKITGRISEPVSVIQLVKQTPYVLDTVNEIPIKEERPMAEPDISSQYPYGNEQLVSFNNVKAIPASTTQSPNQAIVEDSTDNKITGRISEPVSVVQTTSLRPSQKVNHVVLQEITNEGTTKQVSGTRISGRFPELSVTRPIPESAIISQFSFGTGQEINSNNINTAPIVTTGPTALFNQANKDTSTPTTGQQISFTTVKTTPIVTTRPNVLVNQVTKEAAGIKITDSFSEPSPIVNKFSFGTGSKTTINNLNTAPIVTTRPNVLVNQVIKEIIGNAITESISEPIPIVTFRPTAVNYNQIVVQESIGTKMTANIPEPIKSTETAKIKGQVSDIVTTRPILTLNEVVMQANRATDTFNRVPMPVTLVSATPQITLNQVSDENIEVAGRVSEQISISAPTVISSQTGGFAKTNLIQNLPETQHKYIEIVDQNIQDLDDSNIQETGANVRVEGKFSGFLNNNPVQPDLGVKGKGYVYENRLSPEVLKLQNELFTNTVTTFQPNEPVTTSNSVSPLKVVINTQDLSERTNLPIVSTTKPVTINKSTFIGSRFNPTMTVATTTTTTTSKPIIFTTPKPIVLTTQAATTTRMTSTTTARTPTVSEAPLIFRINEEFRENQVGAGETREVLVIAKANPVTATSTTARITPAPTVVTRTSRVTPPVLVQKTVTKIASKESVSAPQNIPQTVVSVNNPTLTVHQNLLKELPGIVIQPAIGQSIGQIVTQEQSTPQRLSLSTGTISTQRPITTQSAFTITRSMGTEHNIIQYPIPTRIAGTTINQQPTLTVTNTPFRVVTERPLQQQQPQNTFVFPSQQTSSKVIQSEQHQVLGLGDALARRPVVQEQQQITFPNQRPQIQQNTNQFIQPQKEVLTTQREQSLSAVHETPLIVGRPVPEPAISSQLTFGTQQTGSFNTEEGGLLTDDNVIVNIVPSYNWYLNDAQDRNAYYDAINRGLIPNDNFYFNQLGHRVYGVPTSFSQNTFGQQNIQQQPQQQFSVQQQQQPQFVGNNNFQNGNAQIVQSHYTVLGAQEHARQSEFQIPNINRIPLGAHTGQKYLHRTGVAPTHGDYVASSNRRVDNGNALPFIDSENDSVFRGLSSYNAPIASVGKLPCDSDSVSVGTYAGNANRKDCSN